MVDALEHIELRINAEIVPLLNGDPIEETRSFKLQVPEEVPLPQRIQCLTQVLVIAILRLGSYLNGWTEKWVAKHTKAAPVILEIPVENEEITGKVEDHVTKLLGPLPTDTDFAKDVAEMEKTANTIFSKGLPDWMKEFMADLKEQCKLRRELVLDRLRISSEKLRNTTAIESMAEMTMGRISEHWETTFAAKVDEKRTALANEAQASQTAAKEIARQLGPYLASPNHRHILDDLTNKEQKRFDEALIMITRYEDEFRKFLWEEILGYRETLSKSFAVYLQIIDALPLPLHFQTTDVEVIENKKRISLKRRIRCATAKIPDELPPRTWEGLKADDIVMIMKNWDETEIEYEGEIKPEEPIESFRSPVHKNLFRTRNKVFVNGIKLFTTLQRTIRQEINGFRNDENAGRRNFGRMTTQLLNG